MGQYRHLVAAQEHHGTKQSASITHSPTCIRLCWALGSGGSPTRGAGDGRRHCDALTQMGNRKRAAWGREHEGISANGQGWSLRSTRGCRLPGCRDVDEPGMQGWEWEPSGEKIWSYSVEMFGGKRTGSEDKEDGLGRQDTSPGDGPRAREEDGGIRGQQSA